MLRSSYDSIIEGNLIAQLDRTGRRLGFASTLRNTTTAHLLGLHPTDWAALDVLDFSGPLPIGTLAKRLALSPAAATALIDRLVAAGHVERRPDDTDRRRVVIHATKRRGKRYERLDADLRAAMAEHAAGFTEAQLRVVLRFMEGAASVLEEVSIDRH